MVLAVASFAVAVNGYAQGRGFDLFGAPRSIVLQSPLQTAVGTLNYSNAIDIHGFDGIAVVDIMSLTNGTIGTGMTVGFNVSNDNTNWTALQNYAAGVSISQSITNNMFGSSTPVITQTAMFPGAITTPTASSAGWATPNIVPSPFTNTGTQTITGKGFYEIAFNANDAGRYLQVTWTGTNAVVSAVFKGMKAQ